MNMDLEKAAERGNPSFTWRAGQERRLELVRRYAPLQDKRILDVGCGMGMYMAAFLRYTPHVFGIEVELERAIEAHSRAKGVTQALGETLPFPDDSFELVFSHEVLEHVTDDRRCLQELVRVTRPGGRIAIFVPNRLYAFETHGLYWRGEYHFGNKFGVNWLPTPWRDRLAPHVRAYTTRDLRQLLEGLSVRTIVHTQIYPGYDNIIARHPQLGRALRYCIHRLERTPLRIFGLSHFLVLAVQS